MFLEAISHFFPPFNDRRRPTPDTGRGNYTSLLVFSFIETADPNSCRKNFLKLLPSRKTLPRKNLASFIVRDIQFEIGGSIDPFKENEVR